VTGFAIARSHTKVSSVVCSTSVTLPGLGTLALALALGHSLSLASTGFITAAASAISCPHAANTSSSGVSSVAAVAHSSTGSSINTISGVGAVSCASAAVGLNVGIIGYARAAANSSVTGPNIGIIAVARARTAANSSFNFLFCSVGDQEVLRENAALGVVLIIACISCPSWVADISRFKGSGLEGGKRVTSNGCNLLRECKDNVLVNRSCVG
jgi:hypothetical protein